ncbi:MAG: STAS domain-containing protein [Saccharofermentans sp.]|nr:STAS domain-containing protein [Saccharofermentans sp.]
MKIDKIQNGKELTLAIEGRLDTETSPELDKIVTESIGGIETLILDFANLEYISSAGLRVLLKSHKAMIDKGQMKITNVSDIVLSIFDVTGFTDILTIE